MLKRGPMYQRFVELVNMGSQELGFVDLGEQWKGGYDLTPMKNSGVAEPLSWVMCATPYWLNSMVRIG